MNPFLYSKLAYDPFKDFVPVSLVALVPSAVVGNVNIPVNSIKELVEKEKAKPGTFQIGVSTPTSQVNVGLLNMMAGTNFTMVPYRGGTTQITGILAGDIPLGMESINVSLPLWRDNKLKILGLVSAQRLSLAPEIPTIAETFPGYDLGIWQSIVAPAGTPREVVTKLHGSIKKVLAMPEVREKLAAAGIEPASSNSPEEFVAFVRSQADVRAKVIQAVGIKTRLTPFPAPATHFLAIALAVTLAYGPAAAQDVRDADAKSYPNRTVRIIVPFPPGGPADIVARFVGQKMSEDWGQPVVIENRAGGNTTIGAAGRGEVRARRLHPVCCRWTRPWS